MNILETIVSYKKKDLADKKSRVSHRNLEDSVFFRREVPSFYEALATKRPSVIGEFKRKSPSRGMINSHSEAEHVAIEYEKAGISAISILTDKEFFGGTQKDLIDIVQVINVPVLRKDFIIDEYQVIESRSIGAAAILLIASVLTKRQIYSFSGLAHNLGMNVLCEIHNMEDLDKISPEIKIIGINNRDLKTFRVDIHHSSELIRFVPDGCLKVAESGINGIMDALKLYELGFDAFLIGEFFMKTADPGITASEFMRELKNITSWI